VVSLRRESRVGANQEVTAAWSDGSGLVFYRCPGDRIGSADAVHTWGESVARRARSKGRPAHGWLLAKFHAVFPGLYYRSGWPTRDGVIPHKLFVLFIRMLESIDAGAELQDARAASLGIALALDGKGSKTKSAVRKLSKRAFPEVVDSSD
jgi:hypothetical protein